MNCIPSRWLSLPLGIALSLELAMLCSAVAIAPSAAAAVQSAERKQSNPPPPPTNPGSSAAGGRRDPAACPQDAVAPTPSPLLTALSPTTQAGLTLAERPTFLVYVPKTSAENAEFSLRTRSGQGVYRTTIALTNAPGIISITLPAQATPLEMGKDYTWMFAVICNTADRLEDRFVMGTVQRIQLDPTRLHQIEQTPARQRIELYQQAGVWYDALALLLQLKRSQPDDLTLNTAWHELLQSGGIDTLISKLK